VDLDDERLLGEVRNIRLVILRAPHPELEVDFLSRPIDRSVRHGECLDLVVFLVIGSAIPDIQKALEGEAAVLSREVTSH
jgi:hypothetical protein